MARSLERNMVKEIMRECFRRQLQPNEEFVMFLVHLLLLNPSWGITKNCLTSRTQVQKLVADIVARLEDKEGTEMKTLKMQFYILWNIKHLKDFIQKSKRRLILRLQPILEKICTTDVPCDEDEMTSLKKLIVFYVILLSGCGNPITEDVFLEGKSALQSIMTDKELKEFCGNSIQQKTLELEKICKTICGIRLFNRHCGRGGAGIPNLQELFTAHEQVVQNDFRNAAERVDYKRELIIQFLNKMYVIKKQNGYPYLECVANPVNSENIEKCKNALIHLVQYKLYIQELSLKLDKLIDDNSKTKDQMDALLEDIHDNVLYRLFVPIDFIRALFNKLSDQWTNLHNQVILLTKYVKIFDNLESKAMAPVDHFLKQKIISDQDLSRKSEVDKCLISTERIEIVHYDFKMEYLGFCCWYLVESDGILLPAIPDLGIGRHDNKYFGFSSLEAFRGFENDPEYYGRAVLHLARKRPTLINLLGLRDHLLNVFKINELIDKKSDITKTKNKAVQTHVVHIPPNKSNEYTWNVWELKRQCLQFSVLKGYETHSTNTLKTSSTNSVATETQVSVDKTTQFRIDKSVATSEHYNYIFGLRGRHKPQSIQISS